MKLLKTFISYVCYFGTGIVALDQFVADGAMKEIFNVNPAAQQIILALLIIFWVVKILWFVYEKFHLERKERMLKMESEQDDLDDRRAKRLKA